MGIEKVHPERMEVFPGKDGQFYFHHVDGNNEITSQSEGYNTQHSAVEGAQNDHPGLAVVVLTADPRD